ncbi:Poly-beta-1,6-N-acetyl-D-glucosamine N-deacetylase precursor [Chromobacterium violaceum]|uniref:Poly-beta-1,6-N-acetyl-D-glucosamine N-deacetylase n=1 Tax=Chromobacterium violaceum TaxID=536 RepID=A0A447TFU6_CHRVL|nr:Poly-beta-1,6-N-acetyl-D-glucosamine N-deacetylase precursor [Chromobacterium violaceum]
MRADLFNRAAWQLDSRVGVEVYAWLPVDGLRLPPPALFDVYRELGRAGRFRGLLFRGEGCHRPARRQWAAGTRSSCGWPRRSANPTPG